jgi:hypothetical protein
MTICERHRLQEGLPPPDLVHYWGDHNGWPAWPYHADRAWEEVEVEAGWLGRPLAEQLFIGAFAERAELALCRDCRIQAGLELIAAWRATTPPADGWDRALWLLEQGFEAERVASSVNVGPPRKALPRFLAMAEAAGVEPPDRLTVAWRRDRRNRVTVLASRQGWILPGAANVEGHDGQPANVFVGTDGEAYVFGTDRDPTVGQVVSSQHGRAKEHHRQPDERWRPARLAVFAYVLVRSGES